MTPEEEQAAKDIYGALMTFSNDSERSKQAADFRLGISDIGWCPEYNRRLMDQQVPEETDALPAFIGTAIGEHAEQALKAGLWPDAILQAEVALTLQLQDRVIRLPGHPDIILPGWGVWDGKTDYGLSTIEREGPSFQQRFQRNAYALAAWEEGLLGDMPLDDVKVGNFWIDRTGVDKRVHVHIESFDPDVIGEGVEELDSTVYAFLHDEEAEKRPPRQVCEVTCGFFRVCREWETDVHGLITDPLLVGSIEMYAEGLELARRGQRLKDEAKAHLQDISGSTGKWRIRWTWINPTEVPAQQRRGYYKISVSKVKAPQGD